MEKIDAKVVMYALLPVLLLQFLSLAGGVDIIFYIYDDTCSGPGYRHSNISPDVCYSPREGFTGSVSISNAGSNVVSYAYGAGGETCATVVAGPEVGNVCYIGGGYTGAGANGFNGRRRSLLADPTTRDAQMEPNSVIFTEDSTDGHWILTTSNVDQLFSEMLTVPDAEKTNWRKSRGAIFDHL